VTWQAVYNEAYTWYANSSIAATFAAIASAESGLDYTVVNNTPSTGDLSVGLFQINYYGSLYAGRAAAYGTPLQLVQGGLSRQFVAARGIYQGQGLRAWSTYSSGAYLAYLHGYTPAGGASSGGQPTLQQGSSGTSVVTLQNDLDQLGYNLSQDGSFGPATRAAVVNFQARHGLSQDGVVGPLTWAAIINSLPAQSPLGGPVAGPPAPNEPPGNIDASTVTEWSNLVLASGYELGQQLAQINGWANAIGGLG
jgi:hypothetical protein